MERAAAITGIGCVRPNVSAALLYSHHSPANSRDSLTSLRKSVPHFWANFA